MFAKMFSAIFELVPDQSDSIEVGPHCEFLVLGLILLGARAFLRQGLMIQG
jgi:hypothetical protein